MASTLNKGEKQQKDFISGMINGAENRFFWPIYMIQYFIRVFA